MPVAAELVSLPDALMLRRLERLLQRELGIESAALLAEIVRRAAWVKLAQGEPLYREDAPGEAVWFLIDGRLRTSRGTADGGRAPAGELGEDSVLGVSAMLGGTGQTETAVAARDCVLAHLDGGDIERLAADHPELPHRLARLLARQNVELVRVLEQKAPSASRIVIFPAYDGVDIDHFCVNLTEALSRAGPVCLVTRSTLERSGCAELPQLLRGQQEKRYRFMLVIAEPADCPWTRACLGNADRVLVLADDTGPAGPRALEQALLQRSEMQCELVIVRAGHDNAPLRTGDYLKDRHVVRHHHVARYRRADYARLGRHLTGDAVGLVLAGGGARGFVHLGVYKALHERNVPIDVVAGTSIGAIFAGAIAMGLEPDEIINAARSFFVSRNPVNDYTVPLVSLVAGEVLDNMLKEFFFVYDIEDCRIDFLCIAGNLSRASTQILRRGPMWKAVRASVSLPGIFPPVVMDGDLLVDGGVVNNFPVDALEPYGLGTRIGVNLDSADHHEYDLDKLPGVAQRFKDRLLRGAAAKPIPGITSILSRSALLSSAQRTLRNIELTDIYISPRVDDIGLLDFRSFDEGVARGYEHASQALRELTGQVRSHVLQERAPESRTECVRLLPGE
jgi:predicted acylesterase/phospholipase RssA/CRP-like cAMP-binding protein